MAGYDWDKLNKEAEKLAFANKANAPSEDQGPPQAGPLRVELAGGQAPPYQAPVMLNAEQEQAAANQVAAQTQATQGVQQQQQQQTQQQTNTSQGNTQQAGMVPLQTTVTSQQLPPALLKQQQALLTQQQQAVDAGTAATVAQNTLLAEQANQTALQLAQQNQQAAAQLAEDNRQRDAAMATVQKAVDEFNANRTVNPNRAYDRMGAGGRVLAVLGQAFGAFGAAITHSPNYAQQMIERAVDADIRAQEQEIQARGAAVNMANNQLAMFRQKGLDNQQALAATKMNMLQQAQAETDKLLAGTKNPILIAKGQEIKAGLAQTALNTLMNHAQTQVSRVSANPGAAAGPKSVEDQLKLRALEVDVPQADPKTGAETGHKTLLAKTAQDAEKVRDALVTKISIQRDLSDMRKAVMGTAQSLNPNAKAKLSNKYKQLKTKLGVMYKLGALAEADLDLVSQLGDPISWTQRDKTTTDLIDQLHGNLNSNFESELKGRGLIH